MPRIRLYTTAWCGSCHRARALLETRRHPFEEVPLDDDPAFRRTVYELGGRFAVPLVMIDGDRSADIRGLRRSTVPARSPARRPARGVAAVPWSSPP